MCRECHARTAHMTGQCHALHREQRESSDPLLAVTPPRASCSIDASIPNACLCVCVRVCVACVRCMCGHRYLGLAIVVCSFSGDLESANVAIGGGASRTRALDDARSQCTDEVAVSPPPPPPPNPCACEHIVFTGHDAAFFAGLTFTRVHDSGTASSLPVYKASFLAVSGGSPADYFLYHSDGLVTPDGTVASAWALGTDATSTSDYSAYALAALSLSCPLSASGLSGWKYLVDGVEADVPLATRCACQCEHIAITSTQSTDTSPLSPEAQTTFTHDPALDIDADSNAPWVYTSDNGLFLRRTAGSVWVLSPTIDGTDDWLAKDDDASGGGPFCPEHVHSWAAPASGGGWLTSANSGGVTSECTCCDAVLFHAIGTDDGERLIRVHNLHTTHGRPAYRSALGYYLMYQEQYSRWVYVQGLHELDEVEPTLRSIPTDAFCPTEIGPNRGVGVHTSQGLSTSPYQGAGADPPWNSYSFTWNGTVQCTCYDPCDHIEISLADGSDPSTLIGGEHEHLMHWLDVYTAADPEEGFNSRDNPDQLNPDSGLKPLFFDHKHLNAHYVSRIHAADQTLESLRLVCMCMLPAAYMR